MANPSKRKGTAGETAIVNYLQDQGFPACERRALNGSSDRGDVAGIHSTVIEAKACKQTDLAGWLKELAAEMRNDNARFGAVWHKKRGTTNPADWYVTMPGHVFADLLREALR
jgi:hypothetical protein